MAKSTKDLKKTGKNPRIVTDNSLEKLNDNLVTFGDLGGVVYNTLLGELVSANQRTSLFNLKKNRIEYTEQLKTPTEDGTTAYGYIIIDNQKFSYREVKWEEEKHKAAVLLANTHAGQFDFSMLETEFADIDFEGLGMDDLKADLDRFVLADLDRFVLGDLEDAEGTEGDNTKSTYEAEEDDFEVPEIEEIKTDIVVGDLFEIGRHRLLCGDSTDKETVERLMNGEKAECLITDPPYNVKFNGRKRKDGFRHEVIKGDNQSNIEFDLFIQSFCQIMNDLAIPEVYVFCDWNLSVMLSSYYDFKQCLCVIKNHIGMGGGYRKQTELCLYSGNFKSTDKNDILLFTKEMIYSEKYKVPIFSTLHPTQKPITLIVEIVNNSTNESDLILDLFGGSGSTMVASEQLKRKAYLMELDPKYCEVIVQRMRKLDPSVKITKNGIEI